jgi:HK97 family phage portal protein
MIVQTFEGLQALTTPTPRWSSASGGSVNLYGLNQAYAEIYRTQPNVRICVDFLARNIAQLAPVVYRRLSDTDRVRLVDHDLARWLGKPNPSTRRYRLFENLMGDMGVYFNANWLKVRHVGADRRDAIGLVRIPANQLHAEGGLLKSKFCWTDANGRVKDFALSEIVDFDGYNPTNPLMGLSPLETLRNILAEEAAAGQNREAYWRNASRQEGVIERAVGDPTAKWTKEQKNDWREQWQTRHAGSAAGQVALLEPGWTFKPGSFSAKDSEYTVGGKLRREVVAAAYHIPQPMVGILEHATFSNVKEQHKHLYQDCLGPWLEMIQQEIEGQLLPECEDTTDVYVEFNLDQKLAGTPEERAASLQMAVGRPWRTVNEARALENLPRIDDRDLDTVAPQQGGPSDATAHPTRTDPAGRPVPADDEDEADDATAIAPVLHAARLRQQARLGKLPIDARAPAFFADLDRYNRELTEDLTPICGAEEALRLALEANVATFLELDALETAA